MKEKMTLPGLVANLAIRSGKTKKQCEDFLRELFDTIEQTLVEGESLKIKNFGTFKIIRVEPRKSVDVNTGEDIEIPGHNKVTFMAAKELAELINAPFSMFESVEIPSDNDNFDNAEQLQINSDERTVEAEEYEDDADITDISEAEAEAEELETAAIEDNDIQEESNSPEYLINDNDDTETQEVINSEEAFTSSDDTFYATEQKPKRFRFLFGFLTGVACCALAIGIVVLLLFKDCVKNFNFNRSSTTNTNVVATIQEDTTSSINKEKSVTIQPDTTAISEDETKNQNFTGEEASVPTAASDQVVYDTISKTRYLTTMAKAHYGNYNLWPYIYIENQKILGHPDRIKPGTRVVIPSLSKYNVSPENKQDIETAKKKGLEIYKRYQ